MSISEVKQSRILLYLLSGLAAYCPEADKVKTWLDLNIYNVSFAFGDAGSRGVGWQGEKWSKAQDPSCRRDHLFVGTAPPPR